MNKSVIFFCGHKSPYGLAHLMPILEAGFDIKAVVLASEQRWSKFKVALSGLQQTVRRTGLLPAMLMTVRRIASLRKQIPTPIRVVSEECAKRHIAVWIEDDVNSPEFIERLKGIAPEFLVCAAYPQIFRRDLLDVPRAYAVNFHPSALPRCRGAHPHYWAIATGEREGGVTSHIMTPEVDKGDIIDQITFSIDHLDYGRLYAKIIAETPRLVMLTADYLLRGKGRTRVQNEAQATTFRNDREIHHRVFWTVQGADEIACLVRTQVAFFSVHGRRVRVLHGNPVAGNRNMTNGLVVPPGAVVDLLDPAVIVAARTGFYEVISVRTAKGKLWTGAEWARRHGVRIGDVLG